MEQETVRLPTPYFRPFPKPESVFAGDVTRHAEFVLPLATVSLSHLDPKLEGDLHFVLPIDDSIEGGQIGELTPDFHTYWCRENWVGFHVSPDWRYTLAADFDYFLHGERTVEASKKWSPGGLEGAKRFYETARSSYQAERAKFLERGAVYGPYAEEPVACAYLRGHQRWPNFAELEGFPYVQREYIDPRDGQPDFDYVPIAEDESEFMFIGWMPAYNFAHGVDRNVYLFYNPVHRIALEAFD